MERTLAGVGPPYICEPVHAHAHTCMRTHTLTPTASQLSKPGPTHADTYVPPCALSVPPSKLPSPLQALLSARYNVGGEGAGGPRGRRKGRGRRESPLQDATPYRPHTLPQAPLPPFPCKAYEGRASSSPSSLKLATGEGLCRTLSNRERAETLTLSMGGQGPSLNTVFKCSQCPGRDFPSTPEDGRSN